ncbi:M20/M25/M40 family metallo-hydrolase [bacterium]|nr:M20/M25/M40 family metallo-hydrolase [bacterium]
MINLDTIKDEAVAYLQQLIRINTTNPPGNELEAIKFLSGILTKENIPHDIFESAPGRANLVARLKGNGSKKPLLLTGHVDVVPAEPQHWAVDPFSGKIQDGCIWGRGAVDMKQMVVMELMMLLYAKRNSLNLNRDLIFAAVADEEAACTHGSQWLVENRPELVQAEYALNEVGGFSLYVEDKVFYPIGVAERGICWFRVIAKGDPGHGSMPHDNQAVNKLTGAAHRLGTHHLPFHSHPVVNKFISYLASAQKFPKNIILSLVKNRLFHSFITSKVLPDKKRAKVFNALFHNTVSPTILKAGSKVNVIPSTATFEVDGRILPGQTVESFLNEVREVIGPGLDIEVNYKWNPTEIKDYQNDFYDVLASSVIENHEGAIPVPYLIPGFTDAAHYSRLGIKSYGFAPVKLMPNMNFSEMFHGHNERIPVEGFLWGVKVLGDVIRRA